MTSSGVPEEWVDQVKAMLRGRVRDLRVLLREGRVVLTGRATSYYAKQLAQHFVLKALAATALVNEIEVRPVAPAPEPETSAPG
jgi:hypothetical protein